jgi:hypothetical protein
VLHTFITQELAYVRVVFLLHVSLVVLAIGTRTSPLDRRLAALKAGKCQLRNSPPLSVSTPLRMKGIRASICAKRSQSAYWPRFQTDPTSVQPLNTSTLSKDHRKLPSIEPPQWATVSHFSQPGS